jgi:hypothetical protein
MGDASMKDIDMADVESTEQPIIISEDDARGGESPEEVSVGDTLMPMLVWGLGLGAVGLGAAFLFMTFGHSAA